MLKNNSEIHETPCTDEIRKPCFLCILQLCTDLFFSGVSREQRSIAPFNILIAVEREQNIVLFASLPVSEIESTLILFCAMSAFKNLSGTKNTSLQTGSIWKVRHLVFEAANSWFISALLITISIDQHNHKNCLKWKAFIWLIFSLLAL